MYKEFETHVSFARYVESLGLKPHISAKFLTDCVYVCGYKCDCRISGFGKDPMYIRDGRCWDISQEDLKNRLLRMAEQTEGHDESESYFTGWPYVDYWPVLKKNDEKKRAIDTLRRHIACYDAEDCMTENACDYNCENCVLNISHEELMAAIRIVVEENGNDI